MIPLLTNIFLLSLSVLFLPGYLCVEYGTLKPKSRDGGGDLLSRLHMSKVKRSDVHGQEDHDQHHDAQHGNSNNSKRSHNDKSADGKWNRLDDEVPL